MIVLKKQLLAARRPHEKIESEYDPPTNRTDPFGKEMRDTKIKIRKQKTCGYVANDLNTFRLWRVIAEKAVGNRWTFPP